MILFVFEGAKAEPTVFHTIHKLFIKNEEVCEVKCNYDLPTLYKRLKDNEYDLFRSLPFKENNIEIPENKRLDTMFSQIFLFFDYDFQNRMGVEKLNEVIDEMLDYFDNETEQGKLYINYPMVESLKYTKEMPDSQYKTYEITRESCVNHEFKGMAERFAYKEAKQYKFIDTNKTSEEDVKHNWLLLKEQNVRKANYIINELDIEPKTKDAINQKEIFNSQKEKYVYSRDTVSVLNSFPLFLYEYLK